MLNADQLRRLVDVRSMPKYAEALAVAGKKYMPQYGITSEKDIAAFWAMIGLETGRFKQLEENLNYSTKRLCVVWPSRFKTLAAARPYARNPQALANKVYGGRGGNRGKRNAGWLYRGSGPLHTTFYSNFLRVADATGVDVVNKPFLLREDIDLGMRAACIFWRDNKVSAPASQGQLKKARKIVNGGTHGLKEIRQFYNKALGIMKREGAGDKAANPKRRNPASKILPEYRPQQEPVVTRAVLKKFIHLMPAERRGDSVKLLFVRGYFRDSMGKPGENDRGIYDDAVFVVTPDGVFAFNANSDPSRHRPRIATIKPDQAIRYRPGLHGYSRRGGPYPAFRQDEACFIERDNAGQSHGIFHVNLHRGGTSGTSSEGCLTIPPSQWIEFRDLANRQLKKNGQETFYVTLLEYPGGKHPVDISLPTKPKTNVAPVGVAVIASGGLLVSWWGSIATWIEGLF